ncbi:hypothetical protein JCM10908_004456 [Rhodotorula pacifica]|uniref:uncharacterized protein n=1 Tax=Rhodotorula pacifica TaxID=1495444 RepID=UPI0031729E6C
MIGSARSTSLLLLCLTTIISFASGVATAIDPYTAAVLATGGEGDHSLETRSNPSGDSYLHRSQPSRYEGNASAATLLRNAQLKAAAVDASRSSKMKNVAFRAATIKAAMANNYDKRQHANKKRTKRSPAGLDGDAASERDAEVGELDARAVERARRNVSNHSSPRRDHRARPPRSPQHLVVTSAASEEAVRRQGKDRFRPREITKRQAPVEKQEEEAAVVDDVADKATRMETRVRRAGPPM